MSKNILSNIPSKYLTPLAFSPKGKPVFMIAGGAEDEIPGEVLVNGNQPVATVPNPDAVFTEADLQRARKQEKDKLYTKLEDMQAKLAAVTEQSEAEAKSRAEAKAKAEEIARKKHEEELSAKDLLAQRETEWAAKIESLNTDWSSKFESLAQEREQEKALANKEREFNTLQNYTQQRLDAEKDNIAPQLIDFIDGRTTEEIDSAIEKAKQKSAEIAEQARAAIAAIQSQTRGVSVSGYGTASPFGGEEVTRQYSPEDINNMSMEEYAKFRSTAGLSGGQGKGLFG